MLRARDAALAMVLAAGCTTGPDGRAAPPAPHTAPEPAPTGGRTANSDVRGFANQPDYDGEAALLKGQVTPRLPEPLPTDRTQACVAMFAAADALYERIEPEQAGRAGAPKLLLASRTADQAACERDTSPRAAACVTVLLGDRNAELPWLLDQCARAFPE